MFNNWLRISSLLVVLLIARSAQSQTPSNLNMRPPFHLDLEARASDFAHLFSNTKISSELAPIIAAGEVNLNWLKHINAKQNVKLSFSSRATQIGIPIDQPKIYSSDLIQKSFQEFVLTVPKEMSDVLFHGAAMTDLPPINTEDYLKIGRLMDKIYQYAVRWNTMQVYLPYLATLQVNDVRGYYFLKREAHLTEDFQNWAKLDSARKTQLSEWLMQICANVVRSIDACEKLVQGLNTKDELQHFYDQYFLKSEKLYESYFALDTTRNDVHWSRESNTMTVPFMDPRNTDIADFLKKNIEDEWHWLGWQLHLNFLPQAETHVEFVPGALPHVNQVGGSTITMDANAPLTEYNVQWTIRHEYGHTLGFVDCYLEFYDTRQAAIVSYQLDTSNLMCSRKGKFKEIHLSELEKNYSQLAHSNKMIGD